MVSELMRRLGEAAAGLVRQGLYGEMWGEPPASSGPSLMASGPSALLRSRTTDLMVSPATPGTTMVCPRYGCPLPRRLYPMSMTPQLAHVVPSVQGFSYHALTALGNEPVFPLAHGHPQFPDLGDRGASVTGRLANGSRRPYGYLGAQLVDGRMSLSLDNNPVGYTAFRWVVHTVS